MKIKIKRTKVNELKVALIFMLVINTLVGTVFSIFEVPRSNFAIVALLVCFGLIIMFGMDMSGKIANRKRYKLVVLGLIESIIILLLLSKNLDVMSLIVSCFVTFGVYFLTDMFAIKYACKMNERKNFIAICISFCLLAIGSGSNIAILSFIAVMAQTLIVFWYSCMYYKSLEHQSYYTDHFLKKISIVLFANLLFVHMHEFVNLIM